MQQQLLLQLQSEKENLEKRSKEATESRKKAEEAANKLREQLEKDVREGADRLDAKTKAAVAAQPRSNRQTGRLRHQP